jgi:hypothetical protein
MPAPNETRIPARLVPDEPLPPYTFVPGRHPHPTSDPGGHSYGLEPAAVEPIDPDGWRQSRTYLYGIDLFNAGYFWESHVQFESLWLAAGRRGSVAEFLKGLIKLAAAGVKHLEGRADGVQSHAGRAAELFRAVAQRQGDADRFLGLSLPALAELADRIRNEGWPNAGAVLRPRACRE